MDPEIRQRAVKLLREKGLRSTDQRIAVASLLFFAGDKHVTPADVVGMVEAASLKVSQATVYNVLNEFHDKGLLHQVVVDHDRVYFDTNLEPHHHFLREETGELWDIPERPIKLPKPPQGAEVRYVTVIYRLQTAPAPA
jgi:Fur family iron response transcriptional regulator